MDTLLILCIAFLAGWIINILYDKPIVKLGTSFLFVIIGLSIGINL